MWAGRILEGKALAGRYSRLYPVDDLLVRARQACAEGRRADVEAIYAALELPFKCPPPEQISIAVLPFVNMSTDVENEFFSDGIAEEILNVLASIPDLKVAARTSAFAYKGTNTNISQIAKELGEFEAALILAKKNRDYFSHIVLSRQRNNRSANGLEFYCDPRVQQLYEQSNLPPIEGENICD